MSLNSLSSQAIPTAFTPDHTSVGTSPNFVCPRTFSSLGSLLPGLTGDDSPGYAPSPVWRDSTTKEVKFEPLPKREAVKLWHNARCFERQTRQPGKQDGALGRNALAVLHALLFDFLNYTSGTLYPSRAAIARKACISERSVDRGLTRLKACGVVNWLRRCVEEMVKGRFTLRQLTNAYAVLPTGQWRGYRENLPPPPSPGTWGDHPPLPDVITQACQEATAGGSLKAQVSVMEADPRDTLAAALARLGSGILRRNS